MDSMESSMYVHFLELSKLLDEKNDRYERIYKLNRDVTQKSKRLIFSLQRIPGLNSDETKKIMNTTSNELKVIEQSLLKYIAEELKYADTYQFLNAYTSGLQEYIEAVSFHHFLQMEKIITHSEIQNRLTFRESMEDPDDAPLHVPVPMKEYILGLGDLTGELMRFGIKSISIGDYSMCYKICDTLKVFSSGFMSIGYISSKELFNKICVFKSSLSKVEEACYSLQLRKTELPPDMLGTLLTDMENDVEVPSYF